MEDAASSAWLRAMRAPARSAQRALGHALVNRVAGDDRSARAQVIWAKPGDRWFAPSDPIWVVHADASMFCGGVAALLLQTLHPLAMAGVAGHSGYRGDPWGRLQRTSNFIATTTYATIPDAEAMIAKVNHIHTRVRGKDHRGRPYRADDPHLLGWVHAAEAYAFLVAHQRFGDGGLTEADYDRYVAQIGQISARLGVLDPPQNQAELYHRLASYRPELEVSEAALDACRFMLEEPPIAAHLKPGFALIAAGGLALLPDWAREPLGLNAGTLRRGLRGIAGSFATAAARWGLAGIDDESRSGAASRAA